MRLKDLTDQKFGKLTAIEYLGESKWRCKCECGKETKVIAHNLIKGHTTSCGCARGVGIIGRKFGKLAVIRLAEKRKPSDIYECKCECGEICLRTYNGLINGSAKSCDKCSNISRMDMVKKKCFIDGTQISAIKLNKEPTKANKSGFVGVNWDKSRGKWQASIKFKGHKYNLGRFEYIQDAIDARQEAEKKIFGDFIKWYELYKSKKKEDR
jgi:hypothetical protein